MVLLLFTKKICFLLCIFLLRVECSQVFASDDLTTDHLEVLEKFNRLVKWPMTPIGKFASDIVELFMANSTVVLNETLKKGGQNQIEFFSQAMIQSLANQIGLALCVAIGILIGLFLIFLSCYLSLYQSRQKRVLEDSASEKRIDSKSKGYFLLEFFIICIAVAVFGAVLVIIGSVRSYYTYPVPFGFANFTVKAAFQLKSKLLINHQNRLNDVSLSAFDFIVLRSNVNEFISSDFMQRLQRELQPILSIAASVQWELNKVIQLLESQGMMFSDFINFTTTRTNVQVGKLITSVRNLKQAIGNTTTLDALINLPKINISNASAESYLAPIPTLRELQKVNFQVGLQEITGKLKHIALKVQYDPSDVTEKLKHSAFNVQKNLAKSTSKYVHYIKRYVNETDRDPLLEEIGKAQKETYSIALIFNLVVFVLGLVSLALTIALALAYHGGFFGTHCFRIVREKRRKVFQRNKVSHRSGAVLLFFCYVISIFLWICWLACVFLFFLSSLPLTCCRAMNDYTILDMTFDHIKFRTSPGWYSLLTSDVFNMTLKQTVIRCKNDSSYVPTLPDPVVDTRDATKIKSALNFSDLVANFSSEAENLTPENFTGFDITEFKFVDLIDKIDTSPPFETLESYLTNLTEMNVTDTLKSIKNQASDKNVNTLADTVQRSYDTLLADLSTAIANNGTFMSKIKSVELAVKAVEKHMSYLNWTADALYASIIKNSVRLFDTALKETMAKFIDSVFIEMQLAASDYRKSMSLCGAITLFYDKASAIFCNVVLHSMTCCWFGFFLLTSFLLIAVLISVKSARFFLFLPDVFQEERVPQGIIKPEDIPTKTDPSLSSAAIKGYEDIEEIEENDDKASENSAPEDEDSQKQSEKQKSPGEEK